MEVAAAVFVEVLVVLDVMKVVVAVYVVVVVDMAEQGYEIQQES
jgi:hypothetical protein